VADSGDVVHSRLREGVANSGRGAASFVTETINRARRAGAIGPICVRADSGFYAHKVVDACQRAGVSCSVTVKLTKAVHRSSPRFPTAHGHRSPTDLTMAPMSLRPATGRLAARAG
jgi:Transposase DDE domain group 1